MAKQWMCVVILAFFCAGQRIVLCEDILLAAIKQQLSTPEPSYSIESAVPSPIDEYGAIILTAIDVASGLSDIYDAFERRILLAQQPTAEETSLKIVRHIDDLISPIKDDSEYKTTEATILRALNDIRNAVTTIRNVSDFERLLWLERAQMIDSDIFLLMEGLLGRQVASADLMKKIQENLKCNVTKISAKFHLYNELIIGGLKAFNQFAVLGQMSNLEVSRRNEDFRERNARVLARNKVLIHECYQLQLSQMIKNDPEATSDQIAERAGQVM